MQMSFFWGILGVVLGMGVKSFAVDPPACDVDPKYLISTRSNAGCLVKTKKGVLLVKDILSGGWSVPGGTQELGESASCTAHRETWEETGVSVRVRKLLKDYPHGFMLFDCLSLSHDLETQTQLPLTAKAGEEVTQIEVRDPRTIPQKQWRFPQQRKEIIEFFLSSGE